MQLKPRFSRFVALSVGAAIASTLFQAAPARADKAKNLKYGAIALGAVGAYYLSKGKTVPAAAAAAGGYYAYKKSRDAEDARTDSNRYGYNPYENSNGAIYPDDADSGYGSGYETEYRSSASVRDNRRQNKREKRAERRENKRQERRGNGNFDLNPYLR